MSLAHHSAFGLASVTRFLTVCMHKTQYCGKDIGAIGWLLYNFTSLQSIKAIVLCIDWSFGLSMSKLQACPYIWRDLYIFQVPLIATVQEWNHRRQIHLCPGLSLRVFPQLSGTQSQPGIDICINFHLYQLSWKAVLSTLRNHSGNNYNSHDDLRCTFRVLALSISESLHLLCLQK